MSKPERTLIHHPQTGFQVGYVEGNTFYQIRQESGVLQKPKALAFAKEHLNLFHEMGVVWLNVRVPPMLYISTLEQFKLYGEPMQREAKEEQYFLRIGWWSINGQRPKSKTPKLKPEDYQTKMFDN